MDPIVEKVRKLLALGQSSNPNESAAAIAAATRLMTQHRLSKAEVESEKEDVGYVCASIGEAKRVPAWKRDIMAMIAHFGGCIVYHDRPGGRKAADRWFFVGEETNSTACLHLFAYASAEVSRLSHKSCTGLGRSVHRSFCEGATARIGDRMFEDHKKHTAHVESTALAVLNNETHKIHKWVMSMAGAKADPTRKRRVPNEAAYAEGYVQAKNVDLGGKKIGTS